MAVTYSSLADASPGVSVIRTITPGPGPVTTGTPRPTTGQLYPRPTK